MARSRRVKAFRADPVAIAELLQGRATVVPLPEDVSVVRYHVQWETNSAVLMLESASFDEVPEAHVIPIQDLQFRTFPPVNYHALAEMYTSIMTKNQTQAKDHCPHFDAVSKDRYGVFFLNCKACGTFAMTDEAGAHLFGWIK